MGILDRFRLDGRVALVTGASSGLGVAFATALAEAGADLALAARRADRMEETVRAVQQLGRRAVGIPTDVTDPVACEELVATALERFGRVDVLVNNAGVGNTAPATREDPEDFRRVVETNLMGTYWLSRSCARVMGPGSSIINIGSVLGLTSDGLPHAAYSASKASILGLTRDLAQQWTGRKGIRVNALAPGFFLTDMTASLGPELEELVRSRAPVGRLGRLEECASAVVFLAGDGASYISGAVLPVDGGFLIT